VGLLVGKKILYAGAGLLGEDQHLLFGIYGRVKAI